MGKVDDSDIVEFIPTKLGSDTAGSFAWYLRGADVGLTSDGEDIDAISFTADGDLVVSTIGDFNTPSVSGKDEDLIQASDAASPTPDELAADDDIDDVNLEELIHQIFLSLIEH